jgi:uncharacterized protein (DUF1499 family)
MIIKIVYGAGIILSVLLILLSSLMFFMARQSKSITNSGLINEQLQACPDGPRCVNSLATNEMHSIAAFEVPQGMPDPVGTMTAIINNFPRTEIIVQNESYLHAAFSSAVFGFVDDLEVLKDGDYLQVRSVSRVGRGDMGANRKRVDALHESWRQAILLP